MSRLLAADGRAAVAPAPSMTCDQELASISHGRAHLDQPELQRLVREILKRHVPAGLCLTDIMTFPNGSHKYLGEAYARGYEWTSEGGGSLVLNDADLLFPDGVRLCSLVKDEDGTYCKLEGIKTGPPRQMNALERKAHDARKQSIYPLTTFDVDPKTGAFTRMVRVETAIPLLRNMGLPFLVGKARFLAVCTHKVGTHASGYCKEPNAFSDRAILAEVAYLERNPGIHARPEAPRTTQNIISTIAV